MSTARRIGPIAWALAALVLGAAAPARAADGVLEINHTCATQTGCFPGDAPGYPVTIDGRTGRSYRLTSDLLVPDPNTSGIEVLAASTSIDLGGFQIARVDCAKSPGGCERAEGSGFGIDVGNQVADTAVGVSVRSGTIKGMGASGVRLGPQAEVRNLRALWNGGRGIDVRAGSLVADSAAYENGLDGILAGRGSTVSGCTSFGNQVAGITVYEGSTVTGNAVQSNGGSGIFALANATVSNNTVRSNGKYGIAVEGGSTVTGNSVRDNGPQGEYDGIYAWQGSVTITHNTSTGNTARGILAGQGSTVAGNVAAENGREGIYARQGSLVSGNTARANQGDGIWGEGASMVVGNTCYLNQGYGLREAAWATYRDNTIAANVAGTVTGGGLNLGGNSCNGTATCP